MRALDESLQLLPKWRLFQKLIRSRGLLPMIRRNAYAQAIDSGRGMPALFTMAKCAIDTALRSVMARKASSLEKQRSVPATMLAGRSGVTRHSVLKNPGIAWVTL